MLGAGVREPGGFFPLLRYGKQKPNGQLLFKHAATNAKLRAKVGNPAGWASLGRIGWPNSGASSSGLGQLDSRTRAVQLSPTARSASPARAELARWMRLDQAQAVSAASRTGLKPEARAKQLSKPDATNCCNCLSQIEASLTDAV